MRKTPPLIAAIWALTVLVMMTGAAGTARATIWLGPLPASAQAEKKPAQKPSMGKSTDFRFAPLVQKNAVTANRDTDAPAPEQTQPASEAVLVADNFAYDTQQEVFTASGNVVLEQDRQVVIADSMIYDQKNDTVHAQGNVVYTDRAGQTYFADRVQLEQGMKSGVVEKIGLVFPDGARLAGRQGVRESEDVIILRDGVYSPCSLCRSNPKKAPLWQLRAGKVVHDKKKQDVYYHNVVFDAYGVPVGYLPYFSHPDPSVKARSGLLMSRFSNDSKNGFMLRNYYYHNISPYEDVTMEVSPSTKGGTVFGTEYRRNFEKGSFYLHGSVNHSAIYGGSDDKDMVKPEKWRGHVFSNGYLVLDEHWSTGFSFRRTFDDYYLRDYDFSEEDILQSSLYLQRIKGRDYANIQLMAFQDLRPYMTQDQPDVLPWVESRMIGDPNAMLGGRWELQNEFITLFRNGQQSVSRLSAVPSWERRDILPLGLQSLVNTQFRADSYWIRQNSPYDVVASEPNLDRVESRFVPSLNATVSYPLIRPSKEITALIEPKVGLTIASNNANNSRIPNEDSRDSQIDILNLFESSRFAGADRYETGSHLSYGVKLGGYQNSTGNAVFVTLGQSYRLSSNNPFPEGSGLEDEHSDYVGQIEATIADRFYLDYRFQLGQKRFDNRRHELQAAYSTPRFEFRTNYVFAQEVSGTGLPENRQQIGLSAATRLTERWSVMADTINDLGGAGMLKYGTGIQYKNDCLRASLRLERDLTERLTGGSDTRVLFSLGLRNLGGYDTPLMNEDPLYRPFGVSNRI